MQREGKSLILAGKIKWEQKNRKRKWESTEQGFYHLVTRPVSDKKRYFLCGDVCYKVHRMFSEVLISLCFLLLLRFSIFLNNASGLWYYDQRIISFFSSDFESVFAKHPTGKILSFVFYPKAVYFECKFWISRSAITHVQNWPIGRQRVGSKENDVIYSLA